MWFTTLRARSIPSSSHEDGNFRDSHSLQQTALNPALLLSSQPSETAGLYYSPGPTERSCPRGTGTAGMNRQDHNTSRGVKSSQDCRRVRGKPWRHLLLSMEAPSGSCCCFGYGVFVPLLHGNGNPKAESAAEAFLWASSSGCSGS